ERGPLLFGRERSIELRGSQRLSHASAKSLQGTRRDQPPQRGSQPAQKGANHKDSQSKEIDALDPKTVCQKARDRSRDAQRKAKNPKPPRRIAESCPKRAPKV